MVDLPTAVAEPPGFPRILVAFAILPFALALAAYLAFPLVWAFLGHAGQTDGSAPRKFAMLTGALTVLVSPVALPLVFRAVRQGRASWKRLLLMGAALGNLPFAVYVAGLILPVTVMHVMRGTLSRHLLSAGDLAAGTANGLVIGTSFGMLGAALLWAIVRPYR